VRTSFSVHVATRRGFDTGLFQAPDGRLPHVGHLPTMIENNHGTSNISGWKYASRRQRSTECDMAVHESPEEPQASNPARIARGRSVGGTVGKTTLIHRLDRSIRPPCRLQRCIGQSKNRLYACPRIRNSGRLTRGWPHGKRTGSIYPGPALPGASAHRTRR